MIASPSADRVHPLAGGLALGTSIVLVSIAQVTFKLAVAGLAETLEARSLASWGAAEAVWLAWFGVGALCYGVSMLTWIGALARLPVSLAYPMLSLSFVVVFFAAVLVPGLQERPDLQRLAGIVLVVVGNVIAARAGD